MYYLKAQSENDLWEALEQAGLVQKQYDPEDPLNQTPEGATDFTPSGKYEWRRIGQYDLDVIGTIYEPTGQMIDTEEGSFPEMAPIEGYHANIRGITESQSTFLPVIPKPNNPVRLWAGDKI